ncbi:MAG: cytidylate kinase-like family protein [Sphaerochaeta sp.]
MAVITISRQIGSSGTYIASELAKNLKLAYADKTVIEAVMEEYGFSNFEQVYEERTSFWDRYDEQRQKLVRFLNATLYAFAKTQDVVILGRGGFGLFQSFTDVLNVRIKAPLELRLDRKVKEHGLSEDTMLKALKEADSVRCSFVEHDLGFNHNDAQLFDLVIDTGIVSPATAVNWISEAYAHLKANPRIDGEYSTSALVVDEILLKTVKEYLKNR